MISLEYSDGLLYVPVEICHSSITETIRAIVDTGSAGSAVDINLIRPDFTRHGRLAEIVGVGGSQPAVIQDVDAIRIGNVVLNEFPMEFADLENSFDIQGILGNDFLDKCKAVIDFSSRQLILKPT